MDRFASEALSISRRTAADHVEQRIREEILKRSFSPNEKLPSEDELATSFGFSRRTVREAVCRLEQSGLVEVRHGYRGGVYVRDVTYEPVRESLSLMLQLQGTSLDELLEVRHLVEVWTAECAAMRATDEDIEKLETAVTDLESVLKAGNAYDYRAAVEANFQFHLSIAEAAKNTVLLITMRTVRDLVSQLLESITPLHRRHVEHNLKMHKLILAAITTRNPRLARRRMREHLTTFDDLIRAVLVDSNIPTAQKLASQASGQQRQGS